MPSGIPGWLLRVVPASYEPSCNARRSASIPRRSVSQREARSGTGRRTFRITTDSNHNKPISEDLLDRRFAPTEIESSNRACAGDITYIAAREGWLSLAGVLDLFSRRVIGWSMSHGPESRVVLDALQMAVERRPKNGAVLFHSMAGRSMLPTPYGIFITQMASSRASVAKVIIGIMPSRKVSSAR